MSNEQFKATGFLFDKIKRLYPTFVRPDELDIEVWSEVLEGYSQTDILDALKAYRKNTPYDKAPNPATFKTFLCGSVKTTGGVEFKAESPAEQMMNEDIKSGNCKHLLNVYKIAVDYVLTDKLIDIVGITEWRNIDYSKRYQTAKKNGLFDDFGATLKKVCLNKYGKETQFQSENELKNTSAHYANNDFAGNLAAHWRLD